VKTLSITWSRSELVADAAVIGLYVFSVANPTIAQVVFFFFPYQIAGMNIMQWFQGLCFPLILITLPKLSKDCGGFSYLFSRLLWAYVISLVLLHLRLFSIGRLPDDMVNTERMVYFKIIFALLLWYYVSNLVQSHKSARRLLQSILLGALISASWILICYFSGIGSANYASAGITATAGSEGVSGKAMAGFLLPAAAGAMFLALRDDAYRWAVCASLLLAAVFVTFDRSAQVAFIVSLSWMAIWWVILASPRPCSKTIILFLCITFVLGSVYFVHHRSEELIARWAFDFDRGEIGSGRVTFYTAAWNWFWKESSIMDFYFGMGFGNIFELMHAGSGIFRHTHSDLFDMLLIGGIVGLALYFFLFYTITTLWRGLSVGHLEFGILVALLLSFGVMSLLTGLMEFPHTMYAFGAQCICIRVLAIQEKLDSLPLFLAAPNVLTNSDFHNSKSRNTNS
jgi:hypothetical protein